MKQNDLKLKKRLAQYSTLALAVAGIAESNGQVIYTDEDPDFSGSIGSSFAIDFDGDGVDDVVLHNEDLYAGIYGALYAAPQGSNAVLGSIAGNYAYPFALNAGEMISAGATGSFVGNSYANSLNYVGSYGNWLGGVTDKYLGVQFDISGNTHYGWVRLDVGASSEASFIVKDYAYESTPNAAIEAGDDGNLGLSDSDMQSQINIFNTSSLLTINNNTNSNFELSIYDIGGKEVLNGSIIQESNALDISALSSGMYIVKMSNDINGTFIRKIVK